MGLFDRLAAGVAGLSEDAQDELALALAFADRGDLELAEQRLLILAEEHPRAVPVQLALGEVRARRGDDEGAVSAFGRAVDLAVDTVEAHLGLGEALVRLGRPDPARDAFRRVLAAADDAPRRARAHAGRGRLALAAGRPAKAVRELRRAAELAPEDVGVAADLGRALLAARDPEGWPWLQRVVNASLESAFDAALVIEAAGVSPRREPAESLIRAAIPLARRAADRARLESALGRLLADSGRTDEAGALAVAAVAAAPDDPLVLSACGAIAEARGEWRQALALFDRAGERGAPLAPEAPVRLALGAEDPEALVRAAEALPQGHPLAGTLGRFLAHQASEEDLVALGCLTPAESARRFVARAASPGAPPEGNLFALLAFARDLASRTPELASLILGAARAAEAFDRPLLIAVMGEFNAGKSSFVNAFCGEELAPVGVTPTTATINVLRHGPSAARILYQDGRGEELPATDVASFIDGLGDDAAAIRQVEIFFPLDTLRRVEIVDTPGLNSLRAEHERVARAFLIEADAIVWLFAVGQAAKATERDALALAQEAGKRVLGVLNKADQASPEEIERLLGHVTSAMGDRIEALLPLSARQALRARREGDEAALARSGFSALAAALEERFFGEARALKRRTALQALARFVADARAALASFQPAAEESAGGGPPAEVVARRQGLDAAEESLRGALAAERVALRARLEQAFRHAAGEVLEFVRPRRWPFGERRAEAADEEFLIDMLEDAVGQATESTRRALAMAAVEGPAVPVDAAVERFRAYARGALGGIVERFLHEDLPGSGPRFELTGLQRALARRLPDAEAELFAPLSAEVGVTYARARATLENEQLRAAMRRLVRQERIERPLGALSAAIAGLEGLPSGVDVARL